jgi:cytochrome b
MGCGRRMVCHGCHRGHPQGVPLRGRPWVAVARAIGHGCHRGHPPVGATLAVALAIAVGRAVGHGCHCGHPPVGATLAVALAIAVGRAIGHGCHRGHPQGVPLRGRPWVAVARMVGHGLRSAQTAEHSQYYSELYIRLLVRSNKVKGKKQGGIWRIHVGPEKSTNSCDAIRRIVGCTLDQSVS